jgi:glycosyltransferase involved in cell wall biosynthesis
MSLRIGLMLRNIDDRGGAAVYTRAILDALLRIDQDNEYVLAFASEADRRLYGRPRARNLVVEALSKVGWDQIAVPRALAREQVDVVFNLKHSIPLHSFAPRVFIMHGADWIAFPENYYPFDRMYHRLVLPRYLRSADRVIAVSNDSASRIIAYMPEIAHKLAVVLHGVAPDFRPIADPARREAVRRRYGLPERFLLFVGQIYPQKNVAGILRAMALLGSELPHPLVMAGRTRFKAERDFSLIDELGLADRVRFIDWVAQDDLPVLYSLARMLVFPSLYEGFGIPLLEAMACGCPVLTSNAAACPEVAGDAGLCVDPTPDAIAAGIKRLARDEGLAFELRTRGFERVRGFTWEGAARATLDVLKAAATMAPAAELAIWRYGR